MNTLFVIVLVFSGALATAALLTKSDLARVAIISVALASGFLIPYFVDTAIARSQVRLENVSLLNETCRQAWIAAMGMAHERLRWDARIMFLTNAALAIVAAAPRRKQSEKGKSKTQALVSWKEFVAE